MITINELIGKVKYEDLDDKIQENLSTLLDRMNEIRELWGKPMIVTSGYRSMEKHLQIYKEKEITDKNKIPMKSQHLKGKACDIYDPKQELQKWLLDNIKILIDCNLWCEDFNYTKNWVHFQIIKPRSGKRFFIP